MERIRAFLPTAKSETRELLAKGESQHSAVSPDVLSTEALRPRRHADFHQPDNE